MPKDAPEPIRIPDDAWLNPLVLAMCRAKDANGLFRLARKYGASNERIAYWTGTDAAEASKRVNNKAGSVTALHRWQHIANGLNMPDEARLAIGIAPGPRAAPSGGAGNALAQTAGSPFNHAATVEPTLSERAIDVAAAESARFGEWAEGANVGRFTVEQLGADLRTLSTAYLAGPPVPVFLGARAVRDKAAGLLKDHPAPARARDLYELAGYSCTLLAWISGDLGQLGAADTHARTAWLCADLSDAPELRAWVLSTRSKTAFWSGRLPDAVALAAEGQRWARSTSAAVLLASQEADALAEMRQQANAHAALSIACDARATDGEHETVGGLLSCGIARQSNYAAGVYLRSARPDDALREADRALTAYETDEAPNYGTELQIHITRDDVDGVAHALQPVIDTPLERRLDTVTRRLRQVSLALAGPRYADSREAGTLRESIEDFSAETAQLALPPELRAGQEAIE